MNELYLDDKRMIEVCRAIGSEIRYNIIKIISNGAIDIRNIADKTGLSEPNTNAYVKQIQKAGLLHLKYEPGIRGVKKVVRLNFDKLVIDLG